MTQDGWAKFWAVDLHTHTLASRDVQEAAYGAASPEEVVQAAVAAGLDAIAITDHNTSSWCDAVADAARDASLLVLPGVEISTTEGHLLAVWEVGTPSRIIDELLVRLGIKGDDQGKLDIAAEVGFKDAAKEIVASGGVAIAAHADKPRGLLKLPVAAHVKATLLDECLAAVEVVDLATVEVVSAKIGDERTLACIRGSDVLLPGSNVHVLKGIGQRRTWIKAARPDLIGLKHAFEDADLRVSLEEPTASSHSRIESVSFSGGFLDGRQFDFSPDLNCLLGGTGAGKSLVVEAIRYALGQQVDAASFPNIAKEVVSRLLSTMGDAGVIRVVVSVDGERYAIDRAFGVAGESPANVVHDVHEEWVAVDVDPTEIFMINAFSQGEVLEYSREPVGRMNLVDAGLDFGDLPQRETRLLTDLRQNAEALLTQRELVADLRLGSSKETDVTERVRELSSFFDKDVVKQQEGWKTEASAISKAIAALPDAEEFDVEIADTDLESQLDKNQDLFQQLSAVRADLTKAVTKEVDAVKASVDAAATKMVSVQAQWQARFEAFKATLDEELEKMGSGTSLVALRSQLEKLQEQLVEARQKAKQLKDSELPRLTELVGRRNELLEALQTLRDRRRQLRRDRAAALNAKTAGIVKLDVSAHPDSNVFRIALSRLKTGSRVREDVLDAIANRIHPFRFARCLLDGNTAALVNEEEGIDAASIAKLFANMDERHLWAELLDAQIGEMPDRLEIKFRRPDDERYVSIEQLAHGQKCTAVLVVLLADGDAPVVVDQPEDALHAPWIEDYLVDRLRALRGVRQYIFATRSPGIVVGADAEQIVTMKATSGRGEIEATGSLERYDLNKLALHHLEGGPKAFRRRSGKLKVSVRGN